MLHSRRRRHLETAFIKPFSDTLMCGREMSVDQTVELFREVVSWLRKRAADIEQGWGWTSTIRTINYVLDVTRNILYMTQ